MSTKFDLTFCIADKYIRVLFPEGVDGREWLPTYHPFYVREATEPLMADIHVVPDEVSAEIEGERLGLFDNGNGNHVVCRLPEGGYKILITNVQGELSAAMRTTADFSRVDVSLYGSEAAQHFGLNNCVMVAYAFSGAYFGILLMHSSVIMNAGRGYLFLGSSGTGKSTHSDLWVRHIPGSEILNDDNPAVRWRDGVAYVYGTPWSGKRDFYRQIGLPIGAFVRLQQAKENIIRRSPAVEAYAVIRSSTSTMIWDKPSFTHICDTASAIAATVPVFHLRNLPVEAAARMSYEATQAALAE